MRVSDKLELKGRELFEYLIANKEEIIATKKSMPIKSDEFAVNTESDYLAPDISTKDVGEDNEPNTLVVKVIANTSMFCDSHQDVLAPGCWTKTIKERGVKGKNLIPMIHDHIHKIEAKVGKVLNISSEDMSLKKLGVKSDVETAEVLVFETEIRKDFNAKVFNLYKAGEVNQHSIGLQYLQMELAVNDESEDFKKEYKVWKKYIDQIINKNTVEERGYFWYVKEIRLFENSCVLFGSNELTPTITALKEEPTTDVTPTDNTDEPTDNVTQNTTIKRQTNYLLNI